jgi:biopolymer transport protein ExbB
VAAQFSKFALVDYFIRGGFWMWPLLACSVIGLAVIIYKTYDYWRAGRGADALVAEVSRLAANGGREAAIEKCSASRTCVGAVLAAVLSAPAYSRELAKEAAQAAGSKQLAALEAGLPALSTISNVAPLMGFLGTVTGMIHAFVAVSVHGLGEPHIVAAGIAEALITTATGLIIAIPCFISYGYFVSRVNSLALAMETAGTHLVNLLFGEAVGESHAA